MWDRELRQSLQRIERKLDVIMRAAAREYHHERHFEMATADTLKRLQDDVAANTDATKAAQQALEGFAITVADLTKQLQDAIASGDETAIQAAADAIEANNKTLMDAAAPTAKAVTDNTAAATA
jgi:hypothetical protein